MSNIEDQIRRAMEDGRFDNLPGRGKPLKLEQDPNEDPDWALAHHLLRSSGFTLPWIEAQREIQASIEDIRRALRRAWDWRAQALSESASPALVESEWARALDGFRLQLRVINQRILNYNLDVPSGRFQIRPLNFEHELQLTISPPSDTLLD